jgi:cytochrome b561
VSDWSPWLQSVPHRRLLAKIRFAAHSPDSGAWHLLDALARPYARAPEAMQMNDRADARSTRIAAATGVTALGAAAALAGIVFAAFEANEWLRQIVLERMTPADLELPLAVCPADELQEEGLSQAECEQLVSDVRSYVVSRPGWFAGTQATLAALGTLFAVVSMVGGTALIAGRRHALRLGFASFAALTAVDIGHFVAAQQAGPILRGIHLPAALLWCAIHGAFALALYAALRTAASPTHAASRTYGRFTVASHWTLAISIFFLFVSSWWMLALPLPSEDFRYRELPFQLHKNIGISIALLLIAMAATRFARPSGAAASETPRMRRLRLGGHAALYGFVLAVCVTGYLSSSYSGWSTSLWWLVDLPHWGHENEELNQLFSDLHLWTCWGLLLAMAAHIGAALLHAFTGDDVVRRIV